MNKKMIFATMIIIGLIWVIVIVYPGLRDQGMEWFQDSIPFINGQMLNLK